MSSPGFCCGTARRRFSFSGKGQASGAVPARHDAAILEAVPQPPFPVLPTTAPRRSDSPRRTLRSLCSGHHPRRRNACRPPVSSGARLRPRRTAGTRRSPGTLPDQPRNASGRGKPESPRSPHAASSRRRAPGNRKASRLRPCFRAARRGRDRGHAVVARDNRPFRSLRPVPSLWIASLYSPYFLVVVVSALTPRLSRRACREPAVMPDTGTLSGP